MNNNAIEIKGLTKNYGSFALDNIDLTVEKGTIMGLVGQNGAGKTTLINLIMNKISKDSGEINVYGLDNIIDEPAVKNIIGYIADEEYMYYNYTLAKYAKIFAMAFDRWDQAVFEDYCKRFELPMKKKFSEYSKGMKTKAMLALAIAHDPKLLIMDEPTAGLDPVARIEMLDIIRAFVEDGEHAVLFSTHITSDLDKVADYITLIIDGKIIESMTIDEIEEKYAIASGENTPSDKIKPYLIGCRQNSTSFTALVRRSDIPKLGNVDIRIPDIESLLTHNIWQRKSEK